MILLVLVVMVACGGEEKPAAETTEVKPLKQSKNSSAFNTLFSELLNSYYYLKDALVLTSDTMANNAATVLLARADSFPVNTLVGDKSIVDMSTGYLQTIAAETKGLIGESDMEAKRKSFQMISDNMYDLVRTVRYDGETVYHQFCPMAFNDAGAYWLSRTSDIKNPYFGKKMLSCGEVKDSLSF